MIKCLKTQNQQLREELKLIDKPGKLLLSINYILNGYYFPLNLICTFGCLKIKFDIPPGKKIGNITKTLCSKF